MRVLLTGCTGFVGSFLGPRLIEAGHELFCVCRPDTSVAFGTRVVWNGENRSEVSHFPEVVDVVIHLAQSRNYRQFLADSREMFDVNVAMTMSLLEWAARSKVKHFCLISSGAVYEPFEGALAEKDALAPNGFLGASKLASEVIAKPFASHFALNILRLFFPYGPRQSDRLIPQLLDRVRTGSPIQLADDGEGMCLTPTFIADVADVIQASINNGWVGTMNVASREALSIRSIANLIGEQLGARPKFEIVNKPAINVVPNLDILASRFDLNRFIRFEEGLRYTIAGERRAGSMS